MEDDLPFGKCEEDAVEVDKIKRSGNMALRTPNGSKPINFLSNNFSDTKLSGHRRSLGFGI